MSGRGVWQCHVRKSRVQTGSNISQTNAESSQDNKELF